MAITIRIYHGDTLIHEFIHCKNSEGRFGWYDTVDEKFYDITDEVVAEWDRNLAREHFIDLGISPLK